MTDVVREIERKYEAGDGPLPDLLVPGVDRVAKRGTVELDATYYDTPDQRLARDGITLRRRTGGGDAGWHLKLPVADAGGETARDEIAEPLSEEIPDTLLALARSRVRDRRPLPLMRLRSTRTVRELLDARGQRLAEVAVDRVLASRPDGSRATEWTEIEVELGAGDLSLLDAVEERLNRAGVSRSAGSSKLARALEETGTALPRPPEPVRPAPEDPAARHVLWYARAQVRALVALDPDARRDLPDAVHRMRVATRRLRSCLRTHRGVLRRSVTDPLGAELRWLAAELGVDRDAEVLHQRLAERLEEVPAPLVWGPVPRRLARYSQDRRGGSRQRLSGVLGGERYLRLLDGLDHLLDEPPLNEPDAGRPGRQVMAEAVAAEGERLAVRVGEALAAEPGEGRDLALHEARKAAKRARYAAESARPALGGAAKRFAARMARLQELLGDHQDSVMARAALREIAQIAGEAGEHTFTYGLLWERERLVAEGREAELPGLWRTTPLEVEGASR
ncbi:CYTH and CHAD domain-containing protein [Streptomyces sp. NPDC005438]|uniref:CYTH and CHAD domain-containing protein n=1 Tax=Streptomyces sp. NPDC005438 TaxID=3156880 RepID=UPI0033BAF818